MTRQTLLRNPRLITISLLILTFLLAAVAIVTAITLQRRQNINPTPGQASEDWQDGEACKYITGGGTCAPAIFRDCSPKEGSMCFCRGGSVTRKEGGYTYETNAENDGAIGCQRNAGEDLCATPRTDKQQQEGDGTKCSNPYKCPRAPVVTTPVPNTDTGNITVEAYCDNSIKLSMSFSVSRGGGTLGTGNTTGSVSFSGAAAVDVSIGSDAEMKSSYGTKYPNISRSSSQIETGQASGSTVTFKYTGCNSTDKTPTPTPTPGKITLAPSCISLELVGGIKTKNLSPGQDVSFIMKVQNPKVGSNSGSIIPYNFNNLYSENNPKPAMLPLNNIAGYSTLTATVDKNSVNAISINTTGDNASPIRTFKWKLRYDQIFVADSNNGGQLLTAAQFNGYAGGISAYDPNCVVWVNQAPEITSTPTVTPTTPVLTSTQTATPTPVIPPVCTSITVTNVRNNTVCNSNANPTNCDLKQGDNINVVLTGTNTTEYRSQPSWIGTQSVFTTSASSSHTIPTSALPNNSISINGYTSNGSTVSDNTAACNFTAQFVSTPDVTKAIDIAGSSLLVNASSDPVIVDSSSTVKYDISVKNTGTSGILHNVLVVDSLSAYNAAGVQIIPPFANIIGAENLVRTVGTKSDPVSVTPRFPAGNVYSAASLVKNVEWNKINNLYYGETYKAKVTVDIDTGTAVLRNNVCMYEDSYPSTPNGQFDWADNNSNGVYDYGIDTPRDRLLDCAHVDVATSTPEYTIVKSAITETTTDKVQALVMGDKFRYQVTLKNTSPSNTLNLLGVTVTDSFDSAFESKFDFVKLPTGASKTGAVITWPATADQSGGTLAPGASATYYIMLKVKDSFFTGDTQCSEAVVNNVSATSTSPNFTTPVYQVFVTVGSNPYCNPTPIPPTVTPNTGLPTTSIMKYIGIGLVGFATLIYATAIRRRRLPNFIGNFPLSSTMNQSSLNDKLSAIVSKLKSK